MPRIVKLGLLVVVVCAAIFGGAYLYLNRGDFDEKRNADLARYKADVAQREAAKNSSKDILQKIQAAESASDARQRCLQYPDLPGTHWDPALVAELCRVGTLDFVTIEQIEKHIAENDGAALDRIFDEYAKRDASDPAWHGVWFRAFVHAFEVNTPRVGAAVDHWVKLSPRSPSALVARGTYRINRGYELRGPASSANTPDESVAAMRESLQAGIKDLKAALEFDPRYKPALLQLMYASKGDDRAVDDAGERARALDTTDDMTYYVWLGAASPAWGGSAERRQAILDAAKPLRDRYPLMDVLETREKWFEQGRGRSPAYIAIMDKAPERMALDAAADDPFTHDQILFASESLRFQPTAKNYLRRREILARLPEFRERAAWIERDLASAVQAAASGRTSLEDQAAVLLAQDRKTAATEVYRQILKDNPRQISVIHALINTDLENKDHREEVDSLVDRLIALQPNYSETWAHAAAAAHDVDLVKFCDLARKFHEYGGEGEINYEYQCRNFVMRGDPPEETHK